MIYVPCESPDVMIYIAVFFKSKEQDYFYCNNSRDIVRKKHRCNGVAECSDGSDEKGCEKGKL
jgi:hypothetical protein